MVKERNLKIYRRVKIYRWNSKTIPEIRLQGKWLKDIGFIEGKRIKVKQQKKKLIITLDE